VHNFLRSLQALFDGYIPFKIYAYIELSNYRYPLSPSAKLRYISEQIRATEDSYIDGWYAWSPNNKYENLFAVLAAKNLNQGNDNSNAI
jgi:hypothetical protein